MVGCTEKECRICHRQKPHERKRDSFFLKKKQKSKKLRESKTGTSLYKSNGESKEVVKDRKRTSVKKKGERRWKKDGGEVYMLFRAVLLHTAY